MTPGKMTLDAIAEYIWSHGYTREADAIRAHRCVDAEKVREIANLFAMRSAADVERARKLQTAGTYEAGSADAYGAAYAHLKALLPAEPDPLDELERFLSSSNDGALPQHFTFSKSALIHMRDLIRKAKAARK